MNETLTLVLAWMAGGVLGALFLRRSLVDGAQECLIRTAGALAVRQSAVTDECCSGGILLGRGRSLAAAASMSPGIRHGASGGDLADAAGAGKPNPPGARGRPCALVPMR